jgi:hypothetical protein
MVACGSPKSEAVATDSTAVAVDSTTTAPTADTAVVK